MMVAYRPTSARQRYDLSTRGSNGPICSQGSFDTLESAIARARTWLAAWGSDGLAVVHNEIGVEVWREDSGCLA